MYEFLKITQPYSISFQDRIFILLGINTHGKLEDSAKKLNISAEVALSEDRDIFDLLEQYEDGWCISDYKVWGSYKVAKALGIVKAGKVPDPSGERYKSSGKWGKAGDIKMVDSFAMVGEKDLWEVEMQLNRYRVMLEQKGLKIKKMQLQIMCRDYNTISADSRGIQQGIYMTEVQRLDDAVITSFFDNKQAKLAAALKAGKCDEPCTLEERWNDIRCKSYCEVAYACPVGFVLRGK
jgi:hypothetical protein